MIIGKDIHPKHKIYYLGALILRALSETSAKELDFLTIFEELKKTESVSLNAYTLALDWLFLIGAVDFDNGFLKKCF